MTVDNTKLKNMHKFTEELISVIRKFRKDLTKETILFILRLFILEVEEITNCQINNYELCDDGHDPIYYYGSECPICQHWRLYHGNKTNKMDKEKT